jgi:pimeloyl-ACP methyl ester carboxylesterase
MVPTGKPTLIFIPGAWHHISTWTPITTVLSKHSYTCLRIPLPTTTSDPSLSFTDDVAVVRAAIESETAQGQDVVLIAHSYGGAVASSAIKGFARPIHSNETTLPAPSSSAAIETDTDTDPEPVTPSDQDQGHVIGLILLASGFPATGVPFLSNFGGTPPPIWFLDPATGFATLTVDPRELFYHDLPLSEGEYWVSQLQKQSLKAMVEGGESAYAGWKDVGVWYLHTLGDRALPVEAQRGFVEKAREEGGRVVCREVGGGHSPMLGRVEETVGFILEAVGDFVGEGKRVGDIQELKA